MSLGQLILRKFGQTVVVGGGAALWTLAVFFVLPLIQAVTETPLADTELVSADVADPPEDEEPEEEEPEEEEEEEEPPPELEEQAPPLTFDDMELLGSDGLGGGWGTGDFAIDLRGLGGAGGPLDDLFPSGELEQKPRVLFQTDPVLNSKLRRMTPARVRVAFTVTKQGRVRDPSALESTNPAFERSALDAVKKWKFEAGRRKGEAVDSRMRVWVTFPERR